MTAASRERRLTRLWRAWVELTDRREPATALALVRIGVALVMIVDYVWIWRLGLIDPLWSQFPHGFATSYSGWSHELGLSAHALWAIQLSCAILIAIGLGTRPACLVFALVSAQLSAISPWGESAIDNLLRIVFFVLALSRCNARWSVDAWIRDKLGRPMPALVPAWPRYLLMVQVLWVYFSGGQNKSSAAWGPHGGFTALANALLDPHNGRLDPELIGALYPVTRIATALTMAFELTALAYVLWLYYAATPNKGGRLRNFANRYRIRWIWLGLGVGFEVGIAVGLKLGTFPYGMLALFWVLLLPEELERLEAWMRARLGRSRPAG